MLYQLSVSSEHVLPGDDARGHDDQAGDEPGGAPVDVMDFGPVEFGPADGHGAYHADEISHGICRIVGQALGLPVTIDDSLAGGFVLRKDGVQ